MLTVKASIINANPDYFIGFKLTMSGDLTEDKYDAEIETLMDKAITETAKLFDAYFIHEQIDVKGDVIYWYAESAQAIKDISEIAKVIAKKDTTMMDGYITLPCGVEISEIRAYNDKKDVDYIDWSEDLDTK